VAEPAGVFERKIRMIKSLAKRIWTTLKAEFEKRAKKIKAPQSPEEIIPEFTDDYHKIYGENLLAICLYGSGARGDYIPKRSDLNFLICLTEKGIKGLDRAFKVVAKWHKRRVATPLFMSREYIATSLDTFPLEFLNIKQAHRVVWGKDPLKKVTIRKRQLRLQLEREVKGKLLLLREAYLASRGWKRNLAAVASQSLTAFLSIFEGILYLRGKDIPLQRGGLIRAMAAETGLTAVPFMHILEIKEGKTKLRRKKMKDMMERYIEEVRRLAFWVDKL
jgi:predicted nucleotidyltransferase